MMKFSHLFMYILLSVSLTNGFKSYAQDLIILQTGDTIHCRIQKETKLKLRFSRMEKGYTSNATVEKSKVAKWTYTYFPSGMSDKGTTAPAPERKIRTAPDSSSFRQGERFRFQMTYGPGYLLGNTGKGRESLVNSGVPEHDAKKYYNKLVWGQSGTASLYYQVAEHYRIGACYQGFCSGANIVTTFNGEGSERYYGEIGERAFVNFAGISLHDAAWLGKKQKTAFYAAYSIGPAFYRNETEILFRQVLFKGSSLGQRLNTGMEFVIAPRLSFCVDVSVFRSTLKKVNVTTVDGSQEIRLEKDNWENLGRFDLSAGLVISL